MYSIGGKKRRGPDGKFARKLLSPPNSLRDSCFEEYSTTSPVIEKLKNIIFLIAIMWLTFFIFSLLKRNNFFEKIVQYYSTIFECPICTKCEAPPTSNSTDYNDGFS